MRVSQGTHCAFKPWGKENRESYATALAVVVQNFR